MKTTNIMKRRYNFLAIPVSTCNLLKYLLSLKILSLHWQNSIRTVFKSFEWAFPLNATRDGVTMPWCFLSCGRQLAFVLGLSISTLRLKSTLMTHNKTRWVNAALMDVGVCVQKMSGCDSSIKHKQIIIGPLSKKKELKLCVFTYVLKQKASNLRCTSTTLWLF